MARFFGFAILGLVLLLPAGETVQGQEATLAESYGRGVQAYFNGEYEKSVELLSQAISRNLPIHDVIFSVDWHMPSWTNRRRQLPISKTGVTWKRLTWEETILSPKP